MPEYYEALVADGRASREQCYWHFKKTRGLDDKKRLREYPTYDYEAFLLSVSSFFASDDMIFHNNRIRKPFKESLYVQSLA